MINKSFSCSGGLYCTVVLLVMADQLVDGPPNKRQKVGTPDTPTENAGKK